MTTAVSGLIKIGKAGIDNYNERMRNLEANGYYNVSALKRFFAIELEDYADKEALLHEIFEKHRVAQSELFALDQDLVKQLLLSFEGKIVYPKESNKEKDFEEISTFRKQGERFSFYKKGLQNDDKITFIYDDTIVATVIGEREVEYGGQRYKLSPLVRKLMEQRGELNRSGAYQGAQYFSCNGKKLKDLPNINP
jgi:hypothetical protein